MRELKPTEVIKTKIKKPWKLEKSYIRSTALYEFHKQNIFDLTDRKSNQLRSKWKIRKTSVTHESRQYIKSEPINPKSLSSKFKTEADSGNSKPSNTKSSSSTHGTGSDGWHFERTNTKKGEIPIHNLNNLPVIEKNQKSQKTLIYFGACGVESKIQNYRWKIDAFGALFC